MHDADREQLKNDLSKADKELLVEVVRQGEAFLESQRTCALAADQRALTLVSVLAAVVAILVGGSASLMAANIEITKYWFPVLFVIVICLTAMGLALRAARPSKFGYPGNDPALWVDDVRQNRSYEESLAGHAVLCSEDIEENDRIMVANNAMVSRALFILFVGLIASVSLALVMVFL